MCVFPLQHEIMTFDLPLVKLPELAIPCDSPSKKKKKHVFSTSEACHVTFPHQKPLPLGAPGNLAAAAGRCGVLGRCGASFCTSSCAQGRTLGSGALLRGSSHWSWPWWITIVISPIYRWDKPILNGDLRSLGLWTSYDQWDDPPTFGGQNNGLNQCGSNKWANITFVG